MTRLPPDWRGTTIGEVAHLSLGKMLDRKQATGRNPTPYLRNVNVRWGGFDLSDVASMDIAPDQLERVQAVPGDVVACEGGEPGRAAVWRGPEPVALQKALHRIRPTADINPDFLALQLRSLAESGALTRWFTGTTIKHLPKEKLRDVPIVVPPLDEQERIVAAIEEHLSRLQAAASTVRGIRVRSDRVLLARLAELFSTPNHYETVPLHDVLEASIGGVWGNPPGQDEQDVVVLRVTEFRNDGSMHLSSAAARSITTKQLMSRRLRPGDVLLEKSGGGPTQPVGRVVRVPSETPPDAVPTNFVQLLRPSSALNSDFLFWQMWWWHRAGIANEYQQATTNIRNLKTKDYLSRPVSIPPIEVQIVVAAELDDLQFRLDRMATAAETTLRRAVTLRTAVLRAAFRGDL